VYQRLDPDRIVATARQLSRRIEERFPGSGLGRVAAELIQVAERAAADSVWLERPHRWLRIGVWVLISFLLLAVIGAAVALLPQPSQATLSEVLQAVESAVNDLVFLGIAVWFLLSLETRWKRRRALDSLHGLRAMAHIIDMHQLTKDPERVVRPDSGLDTPSSPERTMTAFELSRYLDYASEMLSLLGKTAALYLQDFDDSVAIAAVNEIESLTTGLSRKIWQKIMIIDRVVA